MTRRYVVHTVLTLAVWVGLGLGVAQAGEIAPVRPKATAPFWELDLGSNVRVFLFQMQGSVEVDVTDSWLPKPGDSVRIVVKVDGVTQPSPSIALELPPASSSFDGITNPFIGNGVLTTSAYPGECGNSPGCDNPSSVSATARDFDLVGDTLTAKDYGGMAVVSVTVGATVKVVIPKDSEFNGIPDNWQNTFCPSTLPCPTGTEDNDPAPVTSTLVGDGHGAFEEYRGFKFRGRHRRMDPRQKDVVAFRTGPWCVNDNDPLSEASSALSRLGGGTVTYPTHGTTPSATLTPGATSGTGVTFTAGAAVFAETDIGREIVVPSTGAGARAEIRGFISPTQVTADITGNFSSIAAIASGSWNVTSLFDNVAGLFGGAQVHLLHKADAPSKKSTEWIDNFERYSVSEGIVLTATTDDRQINKNAVLSGNRVVRGKRVIECVDENTAASLITTTLGLGARDLSAGKGYVILNTKRIVDHISSLIAAGGSRKLKLSTFVNGAWATPTLVGDGFPTNQANKDLLISFALKFYEGMEDGHVGVLTKTETVVQKTSYAYHLAPFSGDQLDQKITTKVDKSTSGFNTFYIPSIYGSTDKADFQAK